MLEINTTNPQPEKPKYRFYVRQNFDNKPFFEVVDTLTSRVVMQGRDAHVIEHTAIAYNLMDMYERLEQLNNKINEITGLNHR